MTYLKRQTIKKFWPIPRKGTKYLTTASHNKNSSIPLVVVAREILGFVANKKELQKLINEKKIKVNGKIVVDAKLPIALFDCIALPDAKKNYKAVLKNKKIGFIEISDKEAESRIYKVLDKKQLKNKKIQLNLSNGKNILFSEKIKVGDFVVLIFKDNKILKTISLDKGSEVIVVKGKHMGVAGKIKNIKVEGQNTIAEIEVENETIKVNVNNLYVK